MARKDWRQRWDPNAELVFCRRVRIGGRRGFAMPGDKVSKALRKSVKPNTLRLWFETGIVELADWTPPEPQRRRAIARREQVLAERLRRVNGSRLREELEQELAQNVEG